MKTTILKFFTLSAAIFAFSTISFGQDTSTGTANAGANIITPISIVKVTDINFGELVPSATTAVTVVMDQTGSITSDAQYFLANSSTPRTAVNKLYSLSQVRKVNLLRLLLPADGVVSIESGEKFNEHNGF